MLQEAAGAPAYLALSPPCTSGTILFNHGLISPATNVLQPPTKQMRTTLLDLYQNRVDSVFKVLHWPTVSTAIERNYQNPQNVSESPTMQPLESAIYFLALCSITDVESERILSCKRLPLIKQYRLATEISISRANLVRNPDLTVLQAFVIYLVSRCSVLVVRHISDIS